MTSANLLTLMRAKEATAGTAPTSGYEQTYVTSDGLTDTTTLQSSQRITGDRAISEYFQTSTAVAGALGFELAFPDVFWALEGLSHGGVTEMPTATGAALTGITASDNTYAATGAWVAGMVIEATGNANAANNSVFVAQSGTGSGAIVAPDGLVDETPPAAARVRMVGFEASDIETATDGFTSTSFDFETMPIVPGQALKTAGLTLPGLNGECEIVSIDTNKIVCKNLPLGWAASAAHSGNIRLYAGDVIRAGSTLETYSIAKKLAGISGSLGDMMVGCAIDTLSLSASTDGPVGGSIGMVGFNAENVTLPEATPSVVQTPGGVFTGAQNVARIALDGVTLQAADIARSIDFNFGNNLLPIRGLSELGPVGYEFGDSTLETSASIKAGAYTYINKRRNAEKISVFSPFRRGNKGMVVSGHQMAIQDGIAVASGRNTEIDIPLVMMAEKDDVLGANYTITVFHYVA